MHNFDSHPTLKTFIDTFDYYTEDIKKEDDWIQEKAQLYIFNEDTKEYLYIKGISLRLMYLPGKLCANGICIHVENIKHIVDN